MFHVLLNCDQLRATRPKLGKIINILRECERGTYTDYFETIRNILQLKLAKLWLGISSWKKEKHSFQKNVFEICTIF